MYAPRSAVTHSCLDGKASFRGDKFRLESDLSDKETMDSRFEKARAGLVSSKGAAFSSFPPPWWSSYYFSFMPDAALNSLLPPRRKLSLHSNGNAQQGQEISSFPVDPRYQGDRSRVWSGLSRGSRATLHPQHHAAVGVHVWGSQGIRATLHFFPSLASLHPSAVEQDLLSIGRLEISRGVTIFHLTVSFPRSAKNPSPTEGARSWRGKFWSLSTTPTRHPCE